MKSASRLTLLFSTLLAVSALVPAISHAKVQDPLSAAISDAKSGWIKTRDAGDAARAAAFKTIWTDLQAGKMTAADATAAMKKLAAAPAVPLTLQESILKMGNPDKLLVPTTCELPPATGRTLYVDPSRGTLTGDGSIDKPFKRLADVVSLAANRKLLQPNDRLILANGDHGRVTITKDLGNTGFLTIMAAPGAHPVIRGMRVDGASRIVFEGLDFTNLIMLKDDNYLLRTYPGANNLVFKKNRFFTMPSLDGLSDADMTNKTVMGVFGRSKCTTYVGNEFFNLNNAFRMSGNKNLAMGNLFHDNVNDNILITASDMTIRYNVILSGRNNPVNAKIQHSDGMQGWTDAEPVNKNIVIDSNFVFNYIPMVGKPKPNAAGKITEVELNNMGTYRQGISIFDGKWDGLTVTNNVVITNAFGGMVFRGPNNALIANNTVISSDPVNYEATQIAIRQAKDRSAFKNVLMVNNITNEVVSTAGVTSRGNVGLIARKLKPEDVFTKFSIAGKTFDMTLKADSGLLLLAPTADAPALDATGKARRVVDGKTDPGAVSK